MEKREKTSDASNLKNWEIFGYGLGGFSSTLPNQFKTQFSMSFMSDVAGIPVGLVGVISMIMSIWDAVNDPIIGHIADNTSTRRWGRYRPHMLMGAVGLAVTIMMMFWIPNLPVTGKLVYYGISLALFSVFFTQFTVPWQAMNSIISTNTHQRNKLLVSRQVIGAVATSLVGLTTAPLVTHFSDVRTGWLCAAGVVVLVVMISALCTISAVGRWDQSQNKEEQREKGNLLLHLKQLTKNKAVLIASLLLGVVNFAIATNAGISMYYLRYVVGNVKILALMSAIQILVTLVLVPFLPQLLRRFGKIPVLRVSAAIQAAAALLLMVLREHATIVQVLAIGLLSTTGMTFANVCCFALIPDCTDYTQLHFGSAQAGFINAVSTFVRKLCGSFSTVFIGGLLSLVGYNAQLPVQAAWIDTIINIKVMVPLFVLAAVLLLSRAYPITPEYVRQMQQTLAQRRTAKKESN